MIIETPLAIILALAMLLSTLLFGVEVLIKRRGMTGQGTGFTFSIIAIPLYLIAFCDKFPSRPMIFRNPLLILPEVDRGDIAFQSSFIILVALVITYALRITVYTRLFIIPALTLSDAEYNSQDQIEQRASDLTAPILAYTALALLVTANVVGAYNLRAAAGAALGIGLILLYYGSVYLSKFWNSMVWLAVQFRIAVRQLWLLASAIVVRAIYVLGKLELWRRGHLQSDDELFFERQIKRLQDSQAKARIRIARERELLQKLRKLQGRKGMTRQSSRDIICAECPAIYSESDIIAARGDEKKSLVEALGSSKAGSSELPSKGSALRRLFGKDYRINIEGPGGAPSTSKVLREKLENLDRLKDWTFTCPNGHEVDGNRGYQIPLAVIGASGSSKSHFLPGMIWETSLISALRPLGITLRQGQFTSTRLSYSMRQLYEEKKILPATPPDEVAGPFGYRLAIRDGNLDTRYSMLLFDVGGEALSSIARIGEQAAFVLLAQGLIVLIDPQYVVRTRFDDADSGIVERERVIAAAKVRDSITLVADALEELWGESMRQVPIPACFVVAKADSLDWIFDWEAETGKVIDDVQNHRSLTDSLVDSSERVKEAFRAFGGGLIIDEVEDRFAASKIRFAAASATGEMPEDDGWANPTPTGISLALLHVLDMLGRVPKNEQNVAGLPGTPSPYGESADMP